MGILVLCSLALITVSFRQSEGSTVDDLQSAGAAALRPFTEAVERVSEPFGDAWEWFDELRTAKDDAERLREENERLRQAAVQNDFALQENERLKELLDYREGPSFPRDYTGLSASVVARPTGPYAQAVVVSVGRNQGVRQSTPVLTGDGLIGLVTRVASNTARVTLLTDQQSAVSAVTLRTGAAGVVRHGQGVGSTLVLDRVPKSDDIRVGDVVVTSGWRSGRLESLYPKGLQIGRVSSVGQSDTDLWKQVQIEPFADFGGIESVIVLVRKPEPSSP